MKDIPQNVKKIYFLGICGTGMGSLAGLLKEKGYDVSGSDENVYPPMSDQLQALQIPVFTPFAPENLERAKPDLVIVGNVMMEKYAESQALLKSGIPYTSMPQAMKHFLLADKDVIVISGTHGKTTTTSIMTFLLTQLGEDVGYFIGGVSKDFGKSFHVGQSRYFVIEGDEYDTAFFEKTPKFIHYNPKHVIMTSLEFDHADIYRDLEHVTEAFQALAKLIPETGSLHYCADYQTFSKVAPLCKAPITSYSHTQAVSPVGSTHWQFQNYGIAEKGSHFDLVKNDQFQITVNSPLFGEYNALNVLSCFSVLAHLGFDLVEAQKALLKFQGVKRRQDVLFQDEKLIVLDDFAHHPTAVKETIGAIRQKYPDRKLVAVFEPRSNTSLRDIFQDEYAASFADAHEVHFPPVLFAHKVKDGKVLDMQKLTAAIQKQGVLVVLHENTASIIDHILLHSKTPTAVLIMSNGAFENIHRRLIEAWQLGK